MRRRFLLLGAALACAAGALLPAAASGKDPLPRAATLSRGWEMRVEPAAPGEPQQPPPEESAPEGTAASAPPTPAGRAAQGPGAWRAVRVPSVFDPRAIASFYPGAVRRYRLRFVAPEAPRGYRWLLAFEQARRVARVVLNGRTIGSNRDPYTPFAVEARGLRPGKPNELMVIVDSRKDPDLPEGWWNWGGIVRPVRLVPAGRAYLQYPGLMSEVSCKGPARACDARLLVDGILERRSRRLLKPELVVRLRSPQGRVTKKRFKLARQGRVRRRIQVALEVPAPMLWSPERPALYSAELTLRDRGRVQQVIRRRVGLRSVEVKRGQLHLNNRRIQLRGASIHEDMPRHGAALTRGDMNRIVADLKALGANVTRAHYVMSEGLLSRLDRAGIMVWNQAPIWQRDHRANLLQYPDQRRRAWRTVRRTVMAARSHPSVITHSVANELSFTPDPKHGTRTFLITAAQLARDLDPTLPVSVDIKGRPGFPEQFTYQAFDMLGINQYFGWYSWVSNFDDLEPYLREMHDLYPEHALVMTEFGAEARPELAAGAADRKGSYAFQAFHVGRTLDVVDRMPFLSGAIYWTLREFEIYPGWSGGVPERRPAGLEPNTRHHKALLSYHGEQKPAWYLARDRFAAVPLYPIARRR